MRPFCSSTSTRYMKACLVKIPTVSTLSFSGPQPVSDLYIDDVRVPAITRPGDVLVKVSATSINPYDAKTIFGYGRNLVGLYRSLMNLNWNRCYQITPGRDVCGTVVDKGPAVLNFNIGDKVFGALGVDRQGAHAEYCVAGDDELAIAPASLDDASTASLPYITCTMMSALSNFAFLNVSDLRHKRILVTGASGALGSIAIQFLSWAGAEVYGTYRGIPGSEATLNRLHGYGAKAIFNTTHDLKEVYDVDKFDIVLDAVGGGSVIPVSEIVPVVKRGGIVVTVNSPLLDMTDNAGLPLGLGLSVYTAASQTVEAFRSGVNYRWAFFMPNGKILKLLSKLIDEKVIVPYIDKVFTFDELLQAYQYVVDGSNKGKVVVKIP